MSNKHVPRIGKFISVMKPTYADFDEVMQAHGGRTYADVKHDGYRAQIHKKSDRFWIFTANGNELNYACYPDVVRAVKQLPTCIIEAELVSKVGGFHKKIYENTKRRFRREGISDSAVEKYLESGIIDEIPLELKVFETLRFEKESLLDMSFSDRSDYTDTFDLPDISPVDTQLVHGAYELEQLVKQTLKGRDEGRVCKNPDSLYVPGERGSIDWVKFKRAESLDLVIVGFYKENNYDGDLPFTQVLCATLNNQTGRYETIGKVSVKRNALANEIFPLVERCISLYRPDNVDFSEKLDSPGKERIVPNSYINPEKSVVLEVRAMNLNYTGNWHTCGRKDGKSFSMRIGFADQVRYDKSPQHATTTAAVRKLYNLQEAMEQ
jgi:DNA ligase-1